MEQPTARLGTTLVAMKDETLILKVEKDGDDGVIVKFSDGTTAGYVVEELLLLRPRRELTDEPGEQNPRHTNQRDLSDAWMLTTTVPLGSSQRRQRAIPLK